MLANHRWRSLVALPVTLFISLALVFTMTSTAEAKTPSTATQASAAKAQAAKAVAAKKVSRKAEKRRAHRVSKAIKIARRQKGDPYRRGGTGPGSFDCSGLIQYSFKKAGVKVPRTSGAQASKLRKVSKRKLRKGDLIYFSNGGRVYHAGIYWGKKKGHRLILHSSRPGSPVKVARIWTSKYSGRTLRL